MKTLRSAFGVLAALTTMLAVAQESAPAVTSSAPGPSTNAQAVPREPRVHDPSTIIKEGSDYWFFCTGNGVNAYRSRDLETWARDRPVFATMPAWHREVVPEQKGHLWAPDVIRAADGRYWLYYSRHEANPNSVEPRSSLLDTPQHRDPGDTGVFSSDKKKGAEPTAKSDWAAAHEQRRLPHTQTRTCRCTSTCPRTLLRKKSCLHLAPRE